MLTFMDEMNWQPSYRFIRISRRYNCGYIVIVNQARTIKPPVALLHYRKRVPIPSAPSWKCQDLEQVSRGFAGWNRLTDLGVLGTYTHKSSHEAVPHPLAEGRQLYR